MDYAIELKFRNLCKKLEPKLGPVDLDALLFLIGVQELGKGYDTFKKDEKVNLIHIAVCTLLEPYGYYKFKGKDPEGWPHFELLKTIPELNEQEQEHLIKEALINYFETNQII